MVAEVDALLISMKDAGQLAGGLSASTFRQRKAGTHDLTHVQVGRRTMLVRAGKGRG